MAQQFKTIDVLRLEIEDDPVGLVNLVQNPNGVMGTWGWVSPVANSGLSIDAFWKCLRFGTDTAQAAYWTTELLPLAGAQYVTGRFDGVAASSAAVTVKVRFEFYDAAKLLISSSGQTAAYGAAFTTYRVAAVQAPAATAYVKMRFDLYNAGGTPLANDAYVFTKAMVTYAATNDFGTTRTNLFVNPDFENADVRFKAGGGTTTPVRSSSWAKTGTYSMFWEVAESSAAIIATGNNEIPVIGGKDYQYRVSVRSGVTDAGVKFQPTITWYEGPTNLGGKTTTALSLTSTNAEAVVVGTAPSNATHARLSITVLNSPGGVGFGFDIYADNVLFEDITGKAADPYFSGATPATSTTTYSWTGTAHASTSIASTNTASYPFSEPVTWRNVLGPAHDIKVTREALNVGTLTATVLDASLDPSQGDLIRPGKRARLTVLNDLTAQWEPLFTGKISHASVSYELKDPSVSDAKRARVELTALDNIAALANQRRTEGVAAIADLPYVLEGCGVPWSVNGSGDQVPTAVVVARNENASAIDQIAVTRDSNLGYAWVNRFGVMTASEAPLMSTTEAGSLDEAVYSDLDVSYNTEDCINEVAIKFLRLNPSTGETEEVPYGPYRDEASITEWGVRSAEFTIQDLTEDPAEIEAYALAILSTNATPVVRINSATVPVATTGDMTPQRALLDLYDLVAVANTTKGMAEQSRITSVQHAITPDKWLVTFGFSADAIAAAPQFTPSPDPGAGGKTIGQLLRPVGEVTMFGGPVAPAGWLKCDGASYLTADYPDLFDAIGYTFGGSGASFNVPNFTDRFPIGAGTKAVGSSGGSSTKTLTTANLPAHAHDMTHDHPNTTFSVEWADNTAGTGTQKRVIDVANSTGGSGGVSETASINVITRTKDTGNAGSGTAFDVLNPWRAINFIIRAI